ncbi:hypothetical protein ACFL1E_05880 [Candidatus Omnitrophota bacterium]
MKLRIRKEILDMTECPRDFECLTNLAETTCPVVKVIPDDHYCFLFVTKKNGGYCQYYMSEKKTGNGLCLCPTRREIYRAYEL